MAVILEEEVGLGGLLSYRSPTPWIWRDETSPPSGRGVRKDPESPQEEVGAFSGGQTGGLKVKEWVVERRQQWGETRCENLVWPKKRFDQAKGDLNAGRVCDWLVFLHSWTTG